jgi:hypothetical protein
VWRGRPRPRMPTTSKSLEISKRKDKLLSDAGEGAAPQKNKGTA